MLIIYSNRDEVIICTEEQEKEMLRLYFHEGGRDKDNYDRDVTLQPLSIQSQLKLNLGDALSWDWIKQGV